MKRWFIISLMVFGIVLLPSYLSAETPQAEARSSLQLELPFKVESRWASGSASSPEGPARGDEPQARRGSEDENLPGILWNTNAGEKYFAIEDGKFISTNPTDTWFVYGWFGPLAAIKEDYNIKYPEWQDRHNGIDFAGREGIEVTSVSSGTVIFAGNKIGNTVIVKTGNYQITYGHLQNVNVKTGQQIKPGDLIGHLGKTGTINPHLHFEVDYLDGKARIAINPVPLINTDWNSAIIPNSPSNSFYAGPKDPTSQPNFSW